MTCEEMRQRIIELEKQKIELEKKRLQIETGKVNAMGSGLLAIAVTLWGLG